MKTILKESMKIAGILYSTDRNSDLTSDDGSSGYTNFKKQKISIEPEAKESWCGVCLWHELYHIFFCNAGVREKLNRIDPDFEEQLCEMLASSTNQVISDNEFIE